MLMKMLADMVGMTPEKLQSEMEGVMGLIKTSSDTLLRVERNTQENARALRAICDHLKIEVPHDGHGDDHPQLPGV